MSPPTRVKNRCVTPQQHMTRHHAIAAVVVALAVTFSSSFVTPARAGGESLFDTEARKSTAGLRGSGRPDILVPARVEGPAALDLTSSASGASAARSEESAVFSVRDGTARAGRHDGHREPTSLFDLAGSSLVATKTFPFVSDVDKSERVSKLIEETAPAATNSNKFFNRRRLAGNSERKTLFDASNRQSLRDDETSAELPPPRNFDIITFGNKRGQDGFGDDGHADDNRAYAAEQEAEAKRRKAEETLKELEERIRLEERLAAARRFRDAQKKQEELRQRELEAASEDGRYADEERGGGDILLRLTQRDRELYPSPSSAYSDNPPVYNQYLGQSQPEEVQPQARSYNVYQQPQGPPEQPPYSNRYNDNTKPSQDYNNRRPSDGYETTQGYGDLDQGGYYGRQPAVIASNNPQGPVIHITLNQHLPFGENGEQQGSTSRPPPQSAPPASDTPVSGPARPPAPPSQAAPPSAAAAPPGFNIAPPLSFSQPFLQAAPQQVVPQNYQFVAIPVPANTQQSPPFQQQAPPATPAPAPQQQQQQPQPVVVVVERPSKAGGYGDNRGYGSDDHSGVGVRVVKGSFDDRGNDYGNESNKARSLSYTFRIPSEQKESYGREPRRSAYPRRPTTYISRSNRGSDIYTSGSKPKEIFLDITPDGLVKSTAGRRAKRSANGNGQRQSPEASSEDVHYFFHIEHDVANDDVGSDDSGRDYGRRDYSVPDTRPRPPPPPPRAVGPPAPPAADQQQVTPPPPVRDQPSPGVQFIPSVLPFNVVQATPVVLAAPQQTPAFNIPVRLSLASKPSATVHHYYVPKKNKFKKLKKGWMWFK